MPNIKSNMNKYELYKELDRGIKSLENGSIYSAEEVFNQIDKLNTNSKSYAWKKKLE